MQGRAMPTPTTIPVDKLARLIGTPACPVIIDVRPDDDFRDYPRLIPGSLRRPFDQADSWARELVGRNSVVVCTHGHELSHGTAAHLRQAGVKAEALEEGTLGWARAALPMVPEDKLPTRDARGRTVWVTRARPKVDR